MSSHYELYKLCQEQEGKDGELWAAMGLYGGLKRK